MGLGVGKKKRQFCVKTAVPHQNAEKRPEWDENGTFSSVFGWAPRFLPKTAVFVYQTLDSSQNYNNTVGIFDFRPSGRDLFTLLRASVAHRDQN